MSITVDSEALRQGVRSAFGVVSDSLKTLHTSMLPGARGSPSRARHAVTDHPLAPDAEPEGGASPTGDRGHMQALGQPFGSAVSSAADDDSSATASTAQRRTEGVASTSGRQLEGDWQDLGSSAASMQHATSNLCDARLQQFQRELQISGKIDMANVRALAYDGVPDQDGLRVTVWKV